MTMKHEYHYSEGAGADYSVSVKPGKAEYHYAEGIEDEELAHDAESGDPDAQSELGQAYITRYMSPLGTQEDRIKGIEWLEKAATQGDTIAEYALGSFYVEMAENKAEEEKGVAWLRKSEARGHLPASCWLARCHEFGIGVEANAAEAVKRYQQIAEQAGNDRTFKFHRHDIIFAQYRLAECYRKGNGVERDAARAVRYYRLAAEGGDPSAQCELGRCLENGIGTPKNEAEAAEWYRKAAEHGSPSGKCELAYCYKNGIGVAKDKAEAVKWFRAAKRCLCPGAERELEELERETDE